VRAAAAAAPGPTGRPCSLWGLGLQLEVCCAKQSALLGISNIGNLLRNNTSPPTPSPLPHPPTPTHPHPPAPPKRLHQGGLQVPRRILPLPGRRRDGLRHQQRQPRGEQGLCRRAAPAVPAADGPQFDPAQDLWDPQRCVFHFFIGGLQEGERLWVAVADCSLRWVGLGWVGFDGMARAAKEARARTLLHQHPFCCSKRTHRNQPQPTATNRNQMQPPQTCSSCPAARPMCSTRPASASSPSTPSWMPRSTLMRRSLRSRA